MIAFTFTIVYLFPQHLGIPPHRHPRFSWIEVSLDFLLFVLWCASSSTLISFGSCLSLNKKMCGEWLSTIVLGYLCMLLFAVTFFMGIKDQFVQGQNETLKGNDHIMFARGNWKE